MSVNYFRGNQTVDIWATDEIGDAILVKSTVANIPSGKKGYAVGCTLIASDTGAQYYNTGTRLSCTFVVGGTVTAGSVGTTQLADGGVTLAKLASGITPSHIVKFGGKITWSGSGASLATTVTGIAATDIVMATIQGAPTQAAYLVSAAPTTNTLTLVLSAANTSNDAVIAYTVFRAAA
jgi:hypothetical protein